MFKNITIAGVRLKEIFLRISEAFKAYGVTLKNINWSVSAENDVGELVVSIWQHHFKKADGDTIKMWR